MAGVSAAVLAGCSGSRPPTVESTPADVPVRTSWALRHRVTESAKLKITGYYISHYQESTRISLGRDANGLDVSCSVRVSAPGWGGPENMVGEKLPTTVIRRELALRQPR